MSFIFEGKTVQNIYNRYYRIKIYVIIHIFFI